MTSITGIAGGMLKEVATNLDVGLPPILGLNFIDDKQRLVLIFLRRLPMFAADVFAASNAVAQMKLKLIFSET